MVFLLEYSNKKTYICNMLERFKVILKETGYTGKDFVDKMRGLSYSSYRSATRKSSLVVPKWVRSFLLGYDLGYASGLYDGEKKSRDANAS